MILLVIAAGAVYATLFLATLILERAFLFGGYADSRPLAMVALSVLVTPTVTTWLAAELMNAISPLRILDRRVRRRAACLATGFGAGFLGVGLGTFALILLDRALPDVLLVGIAAATSTALMLALQARQRPFACPACAYDLSGASPASGGRCTECGFELMGPMYDRLAFRFGPCDDAQVSASPRPSVASLPASFPQPGCP